MEVLETLEIQAPKKLVLKKQTLTVLKSKQFKKLAGGIAVDASTSCVADTCYPSNTCSYASCCAMM